MTTDISVITTVYNCEDYIAESVKSISNQTYKNFEYIIIDDGSADNTLSVIEKLAAADKRITIIKNEHNEGRVKSLNLALAKSKGQYIAIQDADDVSLPERLEKQIIFLKENPEYVLVGSDVEVIDETGEIISNPVRPERDNEARFSLLFRCTFANPSIMYRKTIPEKNGIEYEEKYLHAEDFRFISLISRHGKIYNLSQKLVKYRKHKRNNSTVNFRTLNSLSNEISKENLSLSGISVNEEQVNRIRNLISSRGIEKEFLLEDVKLLFKIIKKFQSKTAQLRNEEIIKTLKRMRRWLGTKNTITRPGYFALSISILTYYKKQVNLHKKFL